MLVAKGDPPWQGSEVQQRRIYGRPSPLSGSLSNNGRALVHLALDQSADLWHFVFAPSRRTVQVVRMLRAVRRVPVVQTIASPPKSFEGAETLLFGDVVVAQSAWTKKRLLDAGVQREIELIRPPLLPPEQPTPLELQEVRQRLQIEPERPVIVYPGDLEFSRGAQRTARLVEALAERRSNAIVVFACRRKTELAASAEADLVSRLDSRRVRFAGELPSLLPLLTLASVVVFPVEDLWAKVDIPIALLEAMALGTPVVVADTGPLSELEAAMRCDVEDTAAWVRAALVLMGDAQRRSAQIDSQRALIGRHYDAAAVACAYEGVYSKFAWEPDTARGLSE